MTTWKATGGDLVRLAGPLMINNIAMAGMQFADAVMAGSIDARSLAAIAVGGSVWFLGFTVFLGILMAISPIVARHYGAGSWDLIGRYTRQGLYFGFLAGIPMILVGQFVAEPFLFWLGIDPEFRDLTVGYVKAITWGAPGIFMFLALRFTTEGVGMTKPIMVTSIIALVVNVFLNYVLMFGHFGAPALGAVGCGYASAITMWVVMLSLLIHMATSKNYEPFHLFSRMAPLRPDVFKEIVWLGVPITVMITAESGLFSAISLLMGTRGTEISAAHQIAINFSSTTFMIPLALSAATTIRVGQRIGAGEYDGARTAGAVGIWLCALFMTFTAVFMLVFRDIVVQIYTDDPIVSSIAVSLLLMAAIFQIADGVQIGAAGALRGYKDTRIPMAVNIFAFWGLAFPLAYLAAITYQAPPNYIWAGFVVGLTVAAVLLSWRYRKLSAAQLAG